MTKKNRVARSKQDLMRELDDQLDNLRLSCVAFDNGTESTGKTIATILRVLLYSYKQSRGLLDQLGYRTSRFTSTCEEFDESNVAPRITLLTINVTEVAVGWLPRANSDPYCRESRRLNFSDWWSEIVVMDGTGKRFTRMDLVMNVADTDGGAHVDASLVDSYMNLTRGNSIGYKFGNEMIPFVGRPVLACMRQIAQEVIDTLRINVPNLSGRGTPIIPPEKETPSAPVGPGQKIQIVGAIPEKYKGIKNLQGTFTLNPVKKIT